MENLCCNFAGFSADDIDHMCKESMWGKGHTQLFLFKTQCSHLTKHTFDKSQIWLKHDYFGYKYFGKTGFCRNFRDFLAMFSSFWSWYLAPTVAKIKYCVQLSNLWHNCERMYPLQNEHNIPENPSMLFLEVNIDCIAYSWGLTHDCMPRFFYISAS